MPVKSVPVCNEKKRSTDKLWVGSAGCTISSVPVEDSSPADGRSCSLGACTAGLPKASDAVTQNEARLQNMADLFTIPIGGSVGPRPPESKESGARPFVVSASGL